MQSSARHFPNCPLTLMSNAELNISLEEHLQETLAPLSDILPSDISSQLLSKTHNPDSDLPPQPRTIPYSLLLSISKWARTPAGLEGLKARKLSPNDYTMIALLAGTTTSPERSFPAYVAPDPVADQKRDNRDRKAITALVNAVLSVLGSGGATWWAVSNIGWQPEWVCSCTTHRARRVAYSVS